MQLYCFVGKLRRAIRTTLFNRYLSKYSANEIHDMKWFKQLNHWFFEIHSPNMYFTFTLYISTQASRNSHTEATNGWLWLLFIMGFRSANISLKINGMLGKSECRNSIALFGERVQKRGNIQREIDRHIYYIATTAVDACKRETVRAQICNQFLNIFRHSTLLVHRVANHFFIATNVPFYNSVWC